MWEVSKGRDKHRADAVEGARRRGRREGETHIFNLLLGAVEVMNFTGTVALFSCVIGAAALSGCAVNAPANSASIGAAGGTLAGATGALRGAQLSVPPGALTGNVVLTMSEGAATAIPSEVEVAGGVVLMGPEGQTFATAVTLTIPTTGAADGLLTRPLGASAWTVVEGAIFDSERSAMVARVNHFSEFVPIRRRACAMDSSCPAGTRCVAGRCAAPSASDAGASDASADASPACAADRDCPAGQACRAGACVSSSGCPAGTVPCAGVCADLTSDARNCGACGSTCAAGQRCNAGLCAGSTPDAGASDGALSCAADRDCPSGQRCAAGVCVAGGACVPSAERCNGLDDDCDGLVDESDPMGAGLCAAGQTCRMGACVSRGGCPAGTVACAGVCADLTSDARNCGACGSACAAGQRCVAGACR